VRSFLILHGWQGSGPDHWQTWLAQRLAAEGEDVRYPDLPEPHAPRAGAWGQALHSELEAMPGEKTVVCHSMACILWAHEVAEIARRHPVERLLLVAPTCPRTPIPGSRDFYPAPLDPEAVAASAAHARVVWSDRDPYCPAGAERSFARPLGLEADFIPGARHINPEAGFGPWPALEAWCRDGAPLVQGAKNGVET
jgi:predicted alpha/beta hydrolase family esterase